MKCPVCGNRDGGCDKKLEGSKFFCITLRSNFEEYSNVPCYKRNYVNRHNPFLPVEAGNREYYKFDLDKGPHKTRIFGEDYNKFLANYDMKPYEKIRFDIFKHEAAVMAIALDKDDYSKERIADGFDFEEDAKAIFLSKGVMKCPVCGNTDGGCDKKPQGAKFFRITLRSNFEEYSNVPCYVRDYVNRHSPVLPVEAGNKEYYYFDLDKRKHRTRVLGGDYNKFLENFDMQPYEHIRFDILKHEAAVMAIALDKDGFSKERIADGFDFEQDSKAIFLSKGVELNPSQIKEINEGVHIHGLGYGGVFIHRFKKTDVVNNGMRIPKTIVSVLGIPEEGATLLLPTTLVLMEE